MHSSLVSAHRCCTAYNVVSAPPLPSFSLRGAADCSLSLQERSLHNAGPYVEMCGRDCIHYTSPLHNAEGFFVPEVAMETESKKEQ